MSDKPEENYEFKNPQIEKLLKDMGGTLKSAMPDGWGFSLLIFSYGEGGGMFYIASAQRADMVRAFSELSQKLGIEAGTDETAANIIGRFAELPIRRPGFKSHKDVEAEWRAIMDDAMTYLFRAKREHPDSAKEFWERLKREGLVT